jgi:hypothetical protein
MKRLLPLLGCLAAVLGSGGMQAAERGIQRTPLDDLLERAGQYVVRYERECSAIVAEERYMQDLVASPGRALPASAATGPTHRELVSDVLMVQLPDETFFGFRDVAIADGHPVRDRAERLEALFLKSRANLRKIQDESARYNLGRIQRTMNVPTYALALLHPGLRGRFAFQLAGEEAIDGTPAVVVAFVERSRPTIVTDRRGSDIPSSGQFWIEKRTGSILRTRLATGTEASPVRAESIVSYRPHPQWRLLLPAEMRESYDEPETPGAFRVVCVAAYSAFRRFDVTVDENIKVPK